MEAGVAEISVRKVAVISQGRRKALSFARYLDEVAGKKPGPCPSSTSNFVRFKLARYGGINLYFMISKNLYYVMYSIMNRSTLIVVVSWPLLFTPAKIFCSKSSNNNSIKVERYTGRLANDNDIVGSRSNNAEKGAYANRGSNLSYSDRCLLMQSLSSSRIFA